MGDPFQVTLIEHWFTSDPYPSCTPSKHNRQWRKKRGQRNRAVTYIYGYSNKHAPCLSPLGAVNAIREPFYFPSPFRNWVFAASVSFGVAFEIKMPRNFSP